VTNFHGKFVTLQPKGCETAHARQLMHASLLSLNRSFDTRNNEKLDINMVSAAFKNRTREEIIAAFRESIRRKHEWQERAEEEIKKIRQERLHLSI